MHARQDLRGTFDSVALLYHEARPRYPPDLFDALVESAALEPGDHLLEVGCATGIATLPLAERGFRVTCVEIGEQLVEQARKNLSSFPNVCVQHGAFETWQPSEAGTFDLVVAATAWKWLDPAVRYRRAWELLRPEGHLAFWSATHVFPDGGDPFFAEIQQVYDQIGAGMPDASARHKPGQLHNEVAEIEASGLFQPVLVREFDWEVDYSADAYLRLLDTFSNHIAMERWQRERLYTAIRHRLRERSSGTLRRGWGAVLHVARRDDGAAQ